MAYEYALRYVINSVDLMSSQFKKAQIPSLTVWGFIYYQC